MTHQEAVEQKYKEAATKIYESHLPVVYTDLPYVLDLAKYEDWKSELEDKIRRIDAPDISEEVKNETVKWAKNELDKFAAKVTSKSK